MKMLQINRNGKSFNIAKHSAFWNKYPTWEPYVSQFMDEYCQKEKITLDIGAWNGVHSLYMAHLSRVVYAIEPDPTAYRELLANCESNPALSVIPIQCAISNVSGTAKIMTQGNSLSSILDNVQTGYNCKNLVDVPCFTFKDFLDKYKISVDDIGFIKMDVEGAEKLCIPDMEWFLKDYQGAFNLSQHKQFIDHGDVINITKIMGKHLTKVPNGWIRR